MQRTRKRDIQTRGMWRSRIFAAVAFTLAGLFHRRTCVPAHARGQPVGQGSEVTVTLWHTTGLVTHLPAARSCVSGPDDDGPASSVPLTFLCLQTGPCGKLALIFGVGARVYEQLFVSDVLLLLHGTPCPRRSPVIILGAPASAAGHCRNPSEAAEAQNHHNSLSFHAASSYIQMCVAVSMHL